jgi:type VI secretion system secreted protein Hcp
MAIDVYLHLEGIKGESSDEGHRGWIECQYLDWRIYQPKSATSSSSGNTAERCEHSSLAIRKLSDLSTPILLQTCSMGTTMPSGKIELFRADAQGGRIKYFELELTNLIVGDVAPEIYEGEILSEHLSLKYSKVKWRYAQQKVSGGSNGLTAGGWDLSTNRIA